MDNIELVRMRIGEIIDAKLERLKQIDEERESILRELEQARRMLNLPEDPMPTAQPVTVVAAPSKPKMDYDALRILLNRQGWLTREEIARYQFTDGRALQAWVMTGKLLRDGDRYGLP